MNWKDATSIIEDPSLTPREKVRLVRERHPNYGDWTLWAIREQHPDFGRYSPVEAFIEALSHDYSNPELLRNISRLGVRDLHYFTHAVEAREGVMEYFDQIAHNPNCDLSTALSLYWFAIQNFAVPHSSWQCEEDDLPWLIEEARTMLKPRIDNLEERLLRREFTHCEFAFEIPERSRQYINAGEETLRVSIPGEVFDIFEE